MNNDGIVRLLVNRECMYQCFFCHEEGVKRTCKEKLSVDDILFLQSVFYKYFNIDRIRLSGGEPLLRKDIIEIVKRLKEQNARVFMTTNGALLEQKKEICQYLEKMNLSVHSLEKDSYKKITNSSVDVDEILEKIKEIKMNCPQLLITIDVTLLKDINTNKEEIEKYINFGENNNISIKFIELFMTNQELLYPIGMLENILIEKGYEKKTESLRKQQYVKGKNQVILSKCFCVANENKKKLGIECKRQNDLFIASDGKISVCRVVDDDVDILNEIKERNEKKLVEKINIAYDKLGNYCIEGE